MPNREMELGGTGNLPVPMGHRSNGMERRLTMEPGIRKSPEPPFRSDRRVACATQRKDGWFLGFRVNSGGNHEKYLA